MKECHVCFYICSDEDEICPLCGAELKTETAQPQTAEEDKLPSEESVIANPVLAAQADSPVTAEIFKDILTENGIAYSVDEEGDIIHVGFGGSFFAINIYVDEKDFDAAADLYRNLTENEMTFDDFEDFEETDGEE